MQPKDCSWNQCIYLLALFLITPVADATLYDLGSDFNEVKNPNDVWSFTAGGSFLPHHLANTNNSNSLNTVVLNGYWGNNSDYDSSVFQVTNGGVSAAGYNNDDFLKADIVIHGTNNSSLASNNALTINWTAPNDGTIFYNGSVWYAHSPVQRKADFSLSLNSGPTIARGTLSPELNRAHPINFSNNDALSVKAGQVLALKFAPSTGEQFASLAGVNLKVNFINGNSVKAAINNVSRIRITPGDSVPAGDKWLQVAEVDAIQSGTGVDLANPGEGTTVYGSSLYSSANTTIAAIDNVIPNNYFEAPGIFHSGESNGKSYLDITFAKPSSLDSITLYGRKDCCSIRDSYNVTLLDNQNNILYSAKDLNANNDKHAVNLPFSTVPLVPTFSLLPANGAAPLKVSLNVHAAVLNNNPNSNYLWSSSDGQTANGKSATLTFSKTGVYTINLNFTDLQGTKITQTKMVTVAPATQLASASFVSDNNTPQQALPILVNDSPVQQLFSAVGDVDWYEFYAKANLSYTIEIPGNSIGRAINPALQLYDASGKALTSLTTQTTSASGIRISGKAPAKGLYSIRVSNEPPFPRINSAEEMSYQIRVFLTDAPQQGIVKGYVLDDCNSSGINEAEVSSLLNGSVTDSTLSYKTGEFGLPLNPDNYSIFSSADSFNNKTVGPVAVTNEDIATVNLELSRLTNCQTATPNLELLKQQAVAVYNEQTKQLQVRDVWSGSEVYYAELENIGDFHFKLTRAQKIPGTIHALPGEYNYTPLIANLPSVYALGRIWQVQLKNQGDFVFSLENAK